MVYKDCDDNDVEKYFIKMKKYLIQYLQLDVSNLKKLLRLKHKELDCFHFDGLRRVPSESVTYENIISGNILLVVDGCNHIAPYVNPNIVKLQKFERCAEIMEEESQRLVHQQTNINLKDDEMLFITYLTLKEKGYIYKLTNPWTNQEFNDTLRVKVCNVDGEYIYTLDENSLDMDALDKEYLKIERRYNERDGSDDQYQRKSKIKCFKS